MSDKNKIAELPSSSNSKQHNRAQLDHVLLDVDFLHKPTVVGFRRKFGWAAIPWLLESYSLMSRATDAHLTSDILLAVADDMRLSDAEAMIAYCLEEGLFILEDSCITNQRVIDDQEALYKTRENWKRKNAKKSESTPELPRGNRGVTARNCEPLNTEVLNVLDLEGSPEGNLSEHKPPEGKKQLAEHVWLSDFEIDAATMEFGRHRLNKADLDRAILHLDKHLSLPSNASKRAYAYKHLVTWALNEAMKERTTRTNFANAQDRVKPKEVPRPISMSPPKHDPPEPQKPLTAEEKKILEENLSALKNRKFA